ncbi:hypothetical protein CS0771_60170 [Catellatospora sp. IY07-71]|nr:hypothetical protein CS0771_60170 [Catellatospora sp. IY07-71]
MPHIRVLARRLLWALLALHVLSLASNFLFHGLGYGRKVHSAIWFATFFNVDEQQNLPAWFSAGVLLLTGWLLWEVGTAAKAAGELRYVRHWRVLGVAFALLSLDDMTDAHRILRVGALAALGNASSWLVVAAPLALVFALAYVRFVQHLPARTRWLMCGAAAGYVIGVTAVEAVGVLTGRNLLAHLPGQDLTGAAYLRYLIAASVEELIQGVAVIVFLYAVGTSLHRYQDLADLAAPPPPAQPGKRGGRRSVVTAFRGPRPHAGP